MFQGRAIFTFRFFLYICLRLDTKLSRLLLATNLCLEVFQAFNVALEPMLSFELFLYMLRLLVYLSFMYAFLVRLGILFYLMFAIYAKRLG